MALSPTFNPSARKIINRYKRANEFELTYGRCWYPLASLSLQALYPDVPLWKSAGICAALSPNIGWKLNLLAVGKVLNAYDNDLTAENTVVVGYKANRRKAFAIASLDNELTDSEAIRSVVYSLSAKENGAPKTRAFFHNLIGNTDVVTIDTHACCVAANVRITTKDSSFSGKQVEQVAECYRVAALKLGISVTELQAVTWIAYRHHEGIVAQASTELFYADCLALAG